MKKPTDISTFRDLVLKRQFNDAAALLRELDRYSESEPAAALAAAAIWIGDRIKRMGNSTDARDVVVAMIDDERARRLPEQPQP